VPKDGDPQWAAVENVIKKGSSSGHADIEMETEAPASKKKLRLDDDEEL